MSEIITLDPSNRPAPEVPISDLEFSDSSVFTVLLFFLVKGLWSEYVKREDFKRRMEEKVIDDLLE